MAIVVADLVAKIRADTSELQQGTQAAKQQLQGVQQQAEVTTRALENMAAAYAKQMGGTQGQALDMFQRQGAVPNSAALAEAERQIKQTAAAHGEAAKAAEKTGAVVAASIAPIQSAARAAEEVGKGWSASESSIVRFGAALIGVNLGISLVAGAARVLHQAISDVVDRQVVWEQSLVRTTALYGSLASGVVATSQAQARAPGLLGSQQEFLSANLNARYLNSRYGLPQSEIYGLTSAAGRASYALGYTEQQRIDLQQRALQFAESGGSGLRNIGIEGDPLSVARRLGFSAPAGLQALTPGDVRQAQLLVGSAGLDQLALAGDAEHRGLITIQAEREKALTQAQGSLQNVLEGGPPPVGYDPRGGGFGSGPGFQLFSTPRALGAPPRVGFEGQDLSREVNAASAALEENRRAVEDHRKSLADANSALAKLGIEAGGAAAHLLSFTGTLEDHYSIAHGDVGAQAQAAVTSRARSAIPAFGMGTMEVSAIGRGTAAAAVWQNYVAEQAQAETANAVREQLTNITRFGPGKDRPAAGRALDSLEQIESVYTRIGEANRRTAQIDMQAADTQAQLDRISLVQRERQLQLARETVDLRRLDVTQQQAGLRATEAVIRAQQSALPTQAIVSAARYQQTLAGAISLQRMARLLQGKDVSDLPTVDQLIGQNQQGQLAEAEAGPRLVRDQRGIELAQQPATAVSLAQALTETQIRQAEMVVELKNLDDVPKQTAYQLALVDTNREQLSVQTETREYLKALVFYMTQRTPMPVPADRSDRIDAGAPRAPGDLAGARR